MAQHWFRTDVAARMAERTALLASIASTGRTFGRGLMPRTLAGQALATGLTGSVNNGLLVTTQSAMWAGVSLVAPRILPEPEGDEPTRSEMNRVRLLVYGTYAVGAVAAPRLEDLIPQRPGESVGRSLARTSLIRLGRVSRAGVVSALLADASYSILRHTELSPTRRRALSGGLMLAAGAGLATAAVHAERTRRAQVTGEPVPPISPATVAVGATTAVGLTLLGKSETYAARAVGGLLPEAVPARVRTAIGHSTALGVLGVGIWQGMEHLYRTIEAGGAAVETLHRDAPAGAHVSGGPASAVPWLTMSREGRRFAALPLTVSEIESVMGSARSEPVRVFIPLVPGETPEERADRALVEMEALGAFDRSLVVLCSPTGTGYINYVMAEAVEYLTRGDCAIVTTQYSLRPSFLSLDRVGVGRANATALFRAVHERIASMPEGARPRVVQFGESLGAHTGQDVYLHRGTAGFAEMGIERALFIGTPDASGWAKSWRADRAGTDPDGMVVEVDSFEQLQALPDDRRAAARIFLISHDEDPITKFGPELTIRQPDWLDPDRSKRPAGIPAEMEWIPLATFFLTVADVLNSMTVVPGQFGAEGHDYREDLARFVSVAYDLPCTPAELATVEAALRARELRIAGERLVVDRLSAARDSLNGVLESWQVDSGTMQRLLADGVGIAVEGAPPPATQAVP